LVFASYAEALGLDALELTLEDGGTVADAISRLRSLPGGDRLPPKPLCAVNLSQARPDTRLTTGDELALLPPLAGG
jgi:molybdopterin synthase sulfur carrier subunit